MTASTLDVLRKFAAARGVTLPPDWPKTNGEIFAERRAENYDFQNSHRWDLAESQNDFATMREVFHQVVHWESEKVQATLHRYLSEIGPQNWGTRLESLLREKLGSLADMFIKFYRPYVIDQITTQIDQCAEAEDAAGVVDICSSVQQHFPAAAEEFGHRWRCYMNAAILVDDAEIVRSLLHSDDPDLAKDMSANFDEWMGEEITNVLDQPWNTQSEYQLRERHGAMADLIIEQAGLTSHD